MLLQRLREHAESNVFDLPPVLYSPRPVRYVIDLDRRGRLLNPESLDTRSQNNEESRVGMVMLAPYLSRSKGIQPLLLADNAQYTLGVSPNGANSERVKAMHAGYLDLVQRCAQATGLQSIQAISRFLDSRADHPSLPETFDTRDVITFRVCEEFPIDFPEVRSFWAREAGENGTRKMQCLVCGECGPVVDRLAKKVKYIPGGKGTGTSIISANRPAFESYGLRRSQVAPTCSQCGEKSTEVANRLLVDESSHIRFPTHKTIFWTERDTPFTWARILDSPIRPEMREQIESLNSCDKCPAESDNRLYCATLSASGGRTVVRDWIDTTVDEVQMNISKWYRSLAVVDARNGDRASPLGIHSLSGAMALNLRDVPVTVTTALLRGAILGTGIPAGLLQRAVNRNRIERRVTRPRAALMRRALAAEDSDLHGESNMVQLDPDSTNPAYLCGRLLAVLERAEVVSTRSSVSAIVDRYFGIASTNPAAVADLLLARAGNHLTVIRRRNFAAYRAIRSYSDEILGNLEEFPTVLGLKDQGLFALGYYHQRVHQLRRWRGDREAPAPFEPDAALAGLRLTSELDI